MSFPVFAIKGQAGTVQYASNSSVLLPKHVLPNLSVKYNDNNGLITLLQGYVEKKLEIRTFYLFGKCFSMAIFSQQNEKTKIDFRNYDDAKPNRNVPFQLPQNIEDKIVGFMNDMNMHCGSLDIIYTPDKRYVFLEVNPVGQFDWLSKECNYFIEEHLAKEMINGLEQAI